MAHNLNDKTEKTKQQLLESLTSAQARALELENSFCEAVPVGLFRTDPEGRCKYVNEKWSSITGLNRVQALDDGWIENLHSKDRENVIKEWQQSINENRSFEMEYRLLNKSQIVWVTGRAVAELDKTGEITGYLGSITDITQQKQAEASLRQSEAQFRNIIDASPVPYALNDEHENITYLNPAFTQTFGYDLNDIPTLEDWWPRAYPDKNYRQWVADTWLQHLEQAKQTGCSFEPVELTIHCKDGSQCTVLAEAAALTEAFKGTHLVILYDITERKQTEIEFQQTAAMLDNVVNSTPDLIFVKNQELKTIFCNHAFARSLGKNREKLYGKTDIENGWDPELVYGNPEKGIRGFIHDDNDALSGKDIHNPFDPANVDGKIHIFDTHKLPLRDTNNDIIGVLGIARNITKRIEAEQIQKNTDQRLKLATEASGIGLWQWNLKTNHIHWDDQMFRIYGIEPTKDGVVSYSVWKNAVLPEDIEQQEDILQHSIRNREQGQREFRIRKTNDNEIRIIEAVDTIRSNAEGEVEWIVGTNLDITKRIQTEEQLRHSQKMDALGKLTGGIAHDFNNMLGVIMGYAELLLTRVDNDPTLQRFANAIFSASNRANKLTSKLLSFSRKQTSDSSSIDINRLLQRDRHMLEKTLTARIELIINLSKELWPVFIDEEMLGDAIINMCINSMHAMPGGGVLTINAENTELDESGAEKLSIQAGDYVRLTLIDTGIGMDQQTINKIFEPFFTTKGDVGTGLGMSQVYGLIKQSQGDIRAYSEPGQGTTIVIYLPRHMENQTLEPDNEKLRIKSKSVASETILVVDDEVALQHLVEDILSANGYRVLCANNGIQALNILDTEQVDLVLSDIIMPEMDGFQLADQIQKKHPDIKIQIISGYNDDYIVNSANKELYDNQLSKPYRSEILLNRIRSLLDNK